MGEGGSIRVHGETYQRLKDLKEEDETLEEVLEKLVEKDLSGEVIERPEARTVGVPANDEIIEKVNEKAGENVSANDVIETLIDQHE